VSRHGFFLYPPALAALLIGGLLSFGASTQVDKWENSRLDAQFKRLAEDRIVIIQNSIDFNLSVLHPVKSFYDSTDRVERSEFRQFVGYLLERYPTVHAFEWIPRVTKEGVPALEQEAAESGQVGFHVHEGSNRQPQDRLEYYPVDYVEPHDRNSSILGLDHASDPEKLKAMKKSRDLKTLNATRPLKLSRFAEDLKTPYGVLAFLPVYQKGEQVPSLEERRKHLIGYVSAVYHVGDMLRSAMTTETNAPAMNLFFYADTPEDDNTLIYAHGNQIDVSQKPAPGVLAHNASLTVGGHIWHVICNSTPEFRKARQRREAQLVFVAGLALSLLFAFYLYSFQRRKIQRAFAELSITDDLTGLHNRRGFMILAEQHRKLAIRHHKGFYFLYADLDGLKNINDTYGHAEGDIAIREAADVLRDSFRESDLAARIGGDEFAVLAFETGPEMNGVLLTHLERKFSDHRLAHPHAYRFSASVGSSYFDPEKPVSVDELMRRADRDLYEKKRSRK